MDMGYADYGGGPGSEHGGGHAGHDTGGVSLATLTGPRTGTPDVSYRLTAREGRVRLASGEQVEGFTLNGKSPGPVLEATEGDLVEVTLVNRNVGGGVTLHWHGVDVPNAEDGVAGVTQDAVARGAKHVYRFVVPDAGTYWYHSHQVSHEQVRKGLFGTFVIAPKDTDTASAPAEDDVVAVVHSYDGLRTINGRTNTSRAVADAGSTARVRVVNTDNGPLRVWVSRATYRVAAIDGRELNGPGVVKSRHLSVPAGGRADLLVRVPDRGFRLEIGGAGLVVGPRGAEVPATVEPTKAVDLLTYGEPADTPFDPEQAVRRFDYNIGRRIGFIDGRPGFWWSINGKLFPDVPMYIVDEGDIVRMTIKNASGGVHPMHLHGHHATVVSRDGVPASGSPWWVDSLDVQDGETFVIAFVADNPGVWMDHCHNLQHAADGLVAHLAYNGVSEPYVVGHEVGDARNHPE